MPTDAPLTADELLRVAETGETGKLSAAQHRQFHDWLRTAGFEVAPVESPAEATVPVSPPAGGPRRTRRGTVKALVTALAGLVGALAVGGPMWVLSEQASRRADAADERAEVARERAAREEELRRESDAVVKQLAQAEVFGRYVASTTSGKELLDGIRRHLAKLAADAERDPGRAGEAADLYRRCGRLTVNLSDWPAATPDYDAARRLAEAALAADDSTGNRRRLAAVLREWGNTRAARVPWYAPAPPEVRDAWDRADALLRPLAETDPESKFVLALLTMVRANKAHAKQKETLYPAAATLVEELLRTSPDDFRYRFALAEILMNSVRLGWGDGNAAARVTRCRRAVTLFRRLAIEKPELPEVQGYLAATLDHLGNSLVESDNTSGEAETAYRESISIYEALVLVFPGVKSHADELAVARQHLQNLLNRRPKK